MLWMLDGAYQHYPAFHYVCGITESVLHGNFDLTGILPFNYTIGQGADLFTTLNSYDFADPVSWLCASLLFMTRVHRYSLMVFAKLWLTGVAFSVYCFLCGLRNKPAVLCGALTYTFSGSILLMFAMHPNFINWAYFLPLLLGGYELFRRSGKKALLLLSVFFNLLTSFYTFYINAVLLVLYVAFRSAAALSKNRTRGTLLTELRTDLCAAGVCLAGALLCAFSLFPTLYAYTQNPRIGGLNGYTASMLHYEKNFYNDAFVSLFCTNIEANYATVIGLSCLALPAVIYFYLYASDQEDGRCRALKLFGAAQLLMMGIPLAGRIMNGMSYASNRWTYSLVFTASVMLTASFSGLMKCTMKRRLAVSALSLAYIGACWFMKDTFDGKYKSASLLLLLVTVVLFLLCGWIGGDGQDPAGRQSGFPLNGEIINDGQDFTGRQRGFPLNGRSSRRAAAGILASLAVFSVFFQGYYIFASQNGDYVSEFESTQEHDYNMSDSSRPLSGLSLADDFFRVESKEYTTNVDGINMVNSTGAWWSMFPHTMTDYLNAFESNAILQNCNFFGLGNRTALLALAGVKYYTSPANVSSLIPYGYVYSPALSDSDYNVYENKLALPAGYTFEHYIRREAFDALSPMQKQEALLQGIVLDEKACEDLPPQITEITADCGTYELDYEIGDLKGLSLTGNTVTAAKDGASMTIHADIPENAELYLQIEGIKLVYPDACNIGVVRYNREPSLRESRIGKISNMLSKWPVVRDGITFDLGIGSSGPAKILVKCAAKSRFTYDSIKLWAVPMDSYESRITALQDNALKDVHIDGREIRGTVDAEQDCLLQVAVPYSIGWTAYIDGQKKQVLNSDLLYMALAVPEGHHEIVLRYRTPFLPEGAAVSLLTLAALLWARWRNSGFPTL